MVYRFGAALTALFPGRCRLCGNRVAGEPGLCQPCRNEAPWLAEACACCSLPLPASHDDSLCGRCQKHAPSFDSTTALFHYQPPVDYLIKRLKFAGELGIGPLLAGLLANRLAARETALPELLIPVPLHRSRLQQRGFNQARELARTVAARLEIRTAHRLCRRHRKTEPQSLLSHNARRLNLRNAFTVTTDTLPAHVAIIDDVMTTGHTANELSRVLKAAGASQVEVWVVARTGQAAGVANR